MNTDFATWHSRSEKMPQHQNQLPREQPESSRTIIYKQFACTIHGFNKYSVDLTLDFLMQQVYDQITIHQSL